MITRPLALPSEQGLLDEATSYACHRDHVSPPDAIVSPSCGKVRGHFWRLLSTPLDLSEMSMAIERSDQRRFPAPRRSDPARLLSETFPGIQPEAAGREG